MPQTLCTFSQAGVGTDRWKVIPPISKVCFVMLQATSFVLQRRVNVSYDVVNHALAERDVRVRLEQTINDAGAAQLLGFRPKFTATGAEREWVSPARVVGAPAFELEVSPWDGNVEIRIRPATDRTTGWSGRKMNRYFDAAHDLADLAARILADLVETRDVEHIATDELTSSAA
jgi:hypothetical protein